MEYLIAILVLAVPVAVFGIVAAVTARRVRGSQEFRRAGEYDDANPGEAAGRAMDKTSWTRSGGSL